MAPRRLQIGFGARTHRAFGEIHELAGAFKDGHAERDDSDTQENQIDNLSDAEEVRPCPDGESARDDRERLRLQHGLNDAARLLGNMRQRAPDRFRELVTSRHLGNTGGDCCGKCGLCLCYRGHSIIDRSLSISMPPHDLIRECRSPTTEATG